VYSDRLHRLDEWTQGLLFGDSNLKLVGSLKRDATRDGMVFNDACPYLDAEGANGGSAWSIPPADRDCRTVASGVFTNGLHAAIALFMSTATRMRGHLVEMSSDKNSTRIRQYLQGSDMYTVNLLERSWLGYALRVEAAMYYDDQERHLHQVLDARTAMLAVFLTALVLCYFTIYGPLVQQMDAQLKRVRGLLVMIPVEIAQTTPSLRHLLMGAARIP